MEQPVFQFPGHEGEKFAFVTREQMFCNAELLFIEYDDIIRSLPFTVLSYISHSPRIMDKICDMSVIEGYGIEALYEYYIHRKSPNIFKDYILDKYKDLDDDKLYTLYFNFFESDPDFLNKTFELNFSEVLKIALSKKSHIAKKIIIWTPVYHDIYKTDISNLFGNSVIYKSGDMKEILEKESRDTTYVFSDMTHINTIREMDRISLSSFIVPKEYDYNYIDGTPKIDIGKLSSEFSMKFDYFLAVTHI